MNNEQDLKDIKKAIVILLNHIKGNGSLYEFSFDDLMILANIRNRLEEDCEEEE